METEPNKNIGNGSSGVSNGTAISPRLVQTDLKTFELENYDAPPGSEKQHHIRLEDLENYVRTMLESNGFKDMYQVLQPGQQKPCMIGEKQENKNKNRYSDLLPYDENRVVLQKTENDVHSDYINASYIDGYLRKKAYICTQGPLEKTLGDFWRMIWQEDVNVIAMTANIVENGKKKCEKYWPEKSAKYADITVTLLREDVFIECTVRTFKMHKMRNSGSRIVRQYQYSAWPDHDVPVYPLSIIFLLHDIQAYQKKQQKFSPIVLHCSAGIGRSGTIMALALAMEMIETDGKVDVLGLLYTLRRQRINLLETVEQFTFVYQALVDYYFGDIPRRKSEELLLYFNKLRMVRSGMKKSDLEQQFERLKEFTSLHFKDKCTVAMTAINRQKNRNDDIVPPDDGRPVLKTNPPSNYINAVYVHDYSKANQFAVTQFPLPNTINDFWQMLYDLNSSTVVVMNEFDKNDETTPVFWPVSGSTFYGNFKVENTFSEAEYFNGVLTRKFKMKNAKGSLKSRTIKMFHLHGWRRDDYIPPRTDSIVHLLNKISRWRKKEVSSPIVVTCYNGCTASGFFCAASCLAGQVKDGATIDVFHAVRTIRSNRPAFIPTMEQYRWLYELACILVTNRTMLK